MARRPLPAAAWTLITLTFLTFTPAHAGDDWPVPRGPSREPVPYRYDPAAWKTVPRELLDDAPACVLYAGTSYLVEPDGTVENVIHEITRFNGRKAIESLGEFRHISYNPAYEKLTLHDVRVHKPDGASRDIGPKHAHLRDIGTDFLVYQPDKQLIISFPDLEVGDVIEVKWTIRGKNPEHAGHFFTRYNFGDDSYPVVLDEMRVRLPKERPLKYAVIGGKIEPNITETDRLRTYHWAVPLRKQLPQDDDLPSKEQFRLKVACSTFASWEEVGQWKQKLRAECWDCTPAIRLVVASVTAGLSSPRDKARALTYWVKRNIRYVSAGESHDYTPHRPAVVLSNRFGDCKDQTQLLAVMLRAAGVSASLATLGVLDDGQVLEDVPSPWGTHAILMVELPGEKEPHWIDTTVTHSAWDFLPFSDRDRLCYVVEDKGPLRLMRTPPLTAADSVVEQTSHVVVGPDGSSRCERVSTWRGAMALGQRDDWIEVPPGERRRLVASDLQDAQSRARLKLLEIDDKQLRDLDQPVFSRVVFDVPDHFTGSPLEGSVSDPKLWGRLLSYNVDLDRTVALDLWQPFTSIHRFLIDLPPALRLDGRPRAKSASSKWGSFELTVKTDPETPGRIELQMVTRLETARVEPADLEAFRKFQDEVSRGYRVWLTLKPETDPDNAPLLEAVLLHAPEDAATTEILVELYRDNEQDGEARRVLKRALHYRPHDVHLWELYVKVMPTLEEEETAYREMTRLFPDEPKYIVARGATLVNLGEHHKAKEVLQPLADKHESSTIRALAWYHLARGFYRQNKFAEALPAFEAARKTDEDVVSSAASLLLLGRIHDKLDHNKEARAAFADVLRDEPYNREARQALIRLCWSAGDKGEALDHLRRFGQEVDGEGHGLATAADWHLRMGRYEDAFELAMRSREAGFTEKAQRVLGLVALHQGKYKEAGFHLGKADLDAAVLEGLLRSALMLGQLSEAESQADRLDKVSDAPLSLKRLCQRTRWLAARKKALLEAAPAASDALNAFVCAEFAHDENAPAKKVEALLDAARVNRELIGPALALRGQRWLDKGRLDRALADADKAIALGPAEARAYLVRGRVRLERGSDAALSDLEKAVELSQRKDGTALHFLAAALFQRGQKQEALKVQKEAVKCKPGDGEIQEQLREYEKAVKSR